MKHYDYVEWLLYKNKALGAERLVEMEEHLYNCDICMKIFLSLIDEKEVEAAGSIIPSDFTDKVVNNLPKQKIKSLKPKQSRWNFNYQFGIYTAVATVTIIMSLSGFFTNIVDAVPKLTSSIEANEEGLEQNIIVKFSDRIINSTSSLITRIENIE